MSGIFPIVQPEAAAEPRRLPLCKEAAWDFETGTPVFSGGKPLVVSGAEAVKMVSDLSNFFRHSLSRGEDIITLGEEEEHVRSYLQIQQARYKDILDYTIRMDPALRETRLPKLTLQPLVENALYHGIKRKRGRGCIRIASQAEGAAVLLQITDDGAGMTAARLEELNRAIE